MGQVEQQPVPQLTLGALLGCLGGLIVTLQIVQAAGMGQVVAWVVALVSKLGVLSLSLKHDGEEGHTGPHIVSNDMVDAHQGLFLVGG